LDALGTAPVSPENGSKSKKRPSIAVIPGNEAFPPREGTKTRHDAALRTGSIPYLHIIKFINEPLL